MLFGSGRTGTPAVLLRGVPIPLADTFRQLGVDVAIGCSKATGPVLSRHLKGGRSALRRLPHLSTYEPRERAISTVVTPLALHAVVVASVMDPDLRRWETVVMRALWGATCLSRAKEIVFSVLSKGHHVFPVMHTRYQLLLWLARVAQRPGVTQVFTEAIWGIGLPPTWDGPGGARAPNGGHPWGGALARAGGAGTSQGKEYPLHFVQEPLRQIQHRIKDRLRCHSSRQLEARRPVTFGGLDDGANGPAPRAGMRVASTELRSCRSRYCAASWRGLC